MDKIIPATEPIGLYDNADFEITYEAQNVDENGVKTDFNFTGYTARAAIYDTPGGTKILDLTVTLSLGEIKITSVKANHAGHAPQSGVWGLLITYPDGKTYPWIAPSPAQIMRGVPS